MTERLDIEHDLPDPLREALRDETRTVGTLYNALQDMDEEAFADRFGGALVAFREALADTDAEFAIAVLGLHVSEDPNDMLAGADLLSVHEPNDDGSVSTLLFTGEAGVPDTCVMLPVRPDDCPPGSGEPVGDISVEAFREIVAAMLFKRFDLLQNDVDGYRDSYLRPTVRGLEAYADAAL
ncbi:hypothetical protein [Halorarius halobius]|uniref:hypothetical protein n=1 Tax=Halorarius halobius TaxID=2962671 RepID=UPI0020CEA723|nr:hypothetical protein [Halorarius halobius]